MKQRVITAVILIAIALPPVILGGIWMYFLIGIVALLGTYEYIKAMHTELDFLFWLLFAQMILFTIAGFLLPDMFYSALMAVTCIVLFFDNVTYPQLDVTKIAYLFLFFALLSLGLKAFLDLRMYGFDAVLYVLLITYVTDSFALIGGMKFGKHKLNERISPKKTIEGSVCGYLCGATVGLGYGLLCTDMPSLPVIIGALIIPIVSQLGDLALSSVKRHYAIKDFSNIFPGHGGMLDRIDSLLFALLTYSIIFVGVV